MGRPTKPIIEARLAFVRRLVAMGYPTATIVDACEVSPLFQKISISRAGRRSNGAPVWKVLTRKKIRELYVFRVKREWRKLVINSRKAMNDAVTELELIIHTALQTGDLTAAIQARRELNRLLNLNGEAFEQKQPGGYGRVTGSTTSYVRFYRGGW